MEMSMQRSVHEFNIHLVKTVRQISITRDHACNPEIERIRL